MFYCCLDAAPWCARSIAFRLAPLLSGLFSKIFAAALFAVAFARKGRLPSLLFPRLQIIRVPFDLFNDVFLEYLALKTAQCAFQSFTGLYLNFRQRESASLSLYPALCRVLLLERGRLAVRIGWEPEQGAPAAFARPHRPRPSGCAHIRSYPAP